MSFIPRLKYCDEIGIFTPYFPANVEFITKYKLAINNLKCNVLKGI
jgi:hypothetical protein